MSRANRPVNLMFYIGSLYHGGAERIIASLCQNLDSEKYSITVCWRNAGGNTGQELVRQGFNVIGVPEFAENVSPYRKFLVLRRLLRDLRVDVIHTHDIGCLADAAQCRVLGSHVRIVHTFHFGNYPFRKWRHLWMERVFSRFAERLVAVGQEQANTIRRCLWLRDSRLLIVPNGVGDISNDTWEGADDGPSFLKKGDIVVGSLSNLTAQKGLFVLLDAVELLRDRGIVCKVVIAGDGPLREDLKRAVRKKRLESFICFVGWIDSAANAFLPSLDVFCQSSLWEANSLVLLEAMAAGLPIVTTNVGESKHIIDDGRTGLVVQPGSAAELAEALERLVTSPSDRKEFGERARRTYEASYTLREMVRNYESIYDSLVGQ